MNMRERIKAAVESHKTKAAEAPPKPPAETIVHLCGHAEQVSNIRNRPCPACQKDSQARRATKRREQLAQRGPQAQGRLPDGAIFDRIIWDAGKTLWTGTLTVNGAEFTASASGVMRLLQELDTLYRRSLVQGES